MPASTRLAVSALAAIVLLEAGETHQKWRVVAGGPEGMRYSSLSQINRSNVNRLRLAWKFDTGDEFPGSEMQCNPIVIDGVLYATSPKLRVIALDAASGKVRWSFDPFAGEKSIGKQRNRGLVYWASGKDRRIFVAARQYLYALDAATGQPVDSFGAHGRVDLRAGLGRAPETLSVSSTTPGVVYKDLLILGTLVSEDLPSAPGHVRAYDTRSGALRWTFHTIPQPGEFGYGTWPKDAYQHTGGANSWAGLTLDVTRGVVYVPTGSAAFDFYGADRHGDNLFANCLIALQAETGKRLWHFQFVKHDVWDRDLPAPPTLVRVRREGKLVDAVAQITKSGFVFVFDRDRGKPLFPVEEREVPPSDVDGELLARTQVLPLAPAPFARQRLTEEMLTNRTPAAHLAAIETFRKVRSGGQFTPPSLEGTIVFPGFDGGGEWGGAAFDPDTHLLYVNSNEMAWILRLVPRKRNASDARALYLRDCSGCHRPDRKGTPPEFPALDRIGAKLTPAQIQAIVRKGAGRMPAFAKWSDEAVEKVARYLLTNQNQKISDTGSTDEGLLKYSMDGYNKFLDPEGYPAIAPPWGTLNAINLDTGEYAWKIPFGEFPKLAAKGLRNTGSENYGGPVVTAGGLLFIGATNHDRKFHAFDKSTGKLLWETELGAAGNATPATYEINGRQYVVIGAGGGKSGSPSGGTYYAFALPD
jgi:quinoprotein glucose dehydrogenase